MTSLHQACQRVHAVASRSGELTQQARAAATDGTRGRQRQVCDASCYVLIAQRSSATAEARAGARQEVTGVVSDTMYLHHATRRHGSDTIAFVRVALPTVPK
jgi:hypothetical protein